MRHKILILTALFLLPLAVRAQSADLSDRVEKWRESFEKKDVGKIILDKEYFFLTEEEANYLFESESGKLKNPPARDFKIVFHDGSFEFQAVFAKILKGKIYFSARPLGNKIGIKVLRARYYGFKIPVKWAEKAINKELDKYFSFLYQTNDYQSARLVIQNKTARLVMEFK